MTIYRHLIEMPTHVSSIRPCKVTECIRWDIDSYSCEENYRSARSSTAGLKWQLSVCKGEVTLVTYASSAFTIGFVIDITMSLRDESTPNSLSIASGYAKNNLLINSMSDLRLFKSRTLLDDTHDKCATKLLIKFKLIVTGKRETTIVEASHAHPSLVDDLTKSKNDGDLADVLLRTDCGATFPAHKLILSLRSPVFRAMFQGAGVLMREGTSDDVHIMHVSKEAVAGLLDYIYSDKIDDGMTLDHATDLVYLADHYTLDLLKEDVCAKIISMHLSIATVCSIMRTATLYELTVLKDTCIKMIKAHMSAVMKTEGWAQLVLDPNAMVELVTENERTTKKSRLE